MIAWLLSPGLLPAFLANPALNGMIAAILVASIRLHFLDVLLHLRYDGPHVMSCDAGLRKGEEMGWFEHGSTIIVLAPPGIDLCRGVDEGDRIRMGAALLRIG